MSPVNKKFYSLTSRDNTYRLCRWFRPRHAPRRRCKNSSSVKDLPRMDGLRLLKLPPLAYSRRICKCSISSSRFIAVYAFSSQQWWYLTTFGWCSRYNMLTSWRTFRSHGREFPTAIFLIAYDYIAMSWMWCWTLYTVPKLPLPMTPSSVKY